MSQPSALRTATRPAPRPRPARRPAPAPLRVVPAAISRTGNAVFAGLCTLLLLAGLVTLLILNTSLAQGAFEATALQQRAGVLTDTQEQLTAAIDQQRSPRQLAARAQGLGMVPGRSMAFIRLSDGAILGTASAATEAQRLTNLGPAPAVPGATPSATPSAKPSATPSAKPSATPSAKPSAATPTKPATSGASAPSTGAPTGR